MDSEFFEYINLSPTLYYDDTETLSPSVPVLPLEPADTSFPRDWQAAYNAYINILAFVDPNEPSKQILPLAQPQAAGQWVYPPPSTPAFRNLEEDEAEWALQPTCGNFNDIYNINPEDVVSDSAWPNGDLVDTYEDMLVGSEPGTGSSMTESIATTRLAVDTVPPATLNSDAAAPGPHRVSTPSPPPATTASATDTYIVTSSPSLSVSPVPYAVRSPVETHVFSWWPVAILQDSARRSGNLIGARADEDAGMLVDPEPESTTTDSVALRPHSAPTTTPATATPTGKTYTTAIPPSPIPNTEAAPVSSPVPASARFPGTNDMTALGVRGSASSNSRSQLTTRANQSSLVPAATTTAPTAVASSSRTVAAPKSRGRKRKASVVEDLVCDDDVGRGSSIAERIKRRRGQTVVDGVAINRCNLVQEPRAPRLQPAGAESPSPRSSARLGEHPNSRRPRIQQQKKMECGKTFKRSSDAMRHHECIHLRIIQVECSKCGGKFSRPDALERHKRTLHAGIIPADYGHHGTRTTGYALAAVTPLPCVDIEPHCQQQDEAGVYYAAETTATATVPSASPGFRLVEQLMKYLQDASAQNTIIFFVPSPSPAPAVLTCTARPWSKRGALRKEV
ncbi:hypothetical protein EVG20_g10783 [Dentipellis fragilis]|uniref:C2H2-type domain-containing protein n=1 Tax=Dentipellis fragilis TaxID=205917 RepID=A0A4Y9XQ79_9AGAM|nr:hypothetical protein EVG20_g10783 [Dentipellis fragilis]